MNGELTKKLFDDFPIIYRGHKLPISQNLMRFGFEYSDGWFDLTYKLSEKLEKMAQGITYPPCESCGEKENAHPTKQKDSKFGIVPACENYQPALPIAVQAKEKFGVLVLYFHNITEEMRELIKNAELESRKTCEICGVSDETVGLRGRSWIFTSCHTHAFNRTGEYQPLHSDEIADMNE